MSKELEIITNTISETAGQFVSTLNQYKWELIPDSQLQAAKTALTSRRFLVLI